VILDFVQVVIQSLKKVIFHSIAHLAFDFIQSEVNNIVVMNFPAGHLIAQFEPDFV
jgi:hypothetical protein